MIFQDQNIQQQINTEAAKNPTIDFKSYRDRLLENDFFKLIKNLPNDYLTHYISGTQWVHNVGSSKIKREIKHSRLHG